MRILPAMREPHYRLYVIGNFFALHGMWAQRTVVAWLAWELTNSAAWVGLIAFLGFAPTLVSGPVFGVWADRTDLKRASMLVQAAQLALGAALTALILSGALNIELLAALSLCLGVQVSAHHPIRLALTPRLAPAGELPNAIAISSLNFNLARLLGPAIGGVSIAAIGPGLTVGATTLFYLPMLAILTRITIRAPATAKRPPAGLFAALTDGARFALGHDAIRAAMGLTVVFATVVRGYLELLAVVADGAFGRGAPGLGALMGVSGAGALAAALLLASRDFVTEARVPRATVWAAFIGFFAAAGAASSPIWLGALALTAITSFCGTMVGVTMQSVVQLATDDEHRGRVLSLWIMVGIGSAVVGALIMGWAADIAGLGPTMTASSAVGAVIVALIRYRRWRKRRSSVSRNLDLSAFEKGRPPPP